MKVVGMLADLCSGIQLFVGFRAAQCRVCVVLLLGWVQLKRVTACLQSFTLIITCAGLCEQSWAAPKTCVGVCGAVVKRVRACVSSRMG